jgi:hypothetical protein
MALTSCSPDTFMLNKYEQQSWVRVKLMNGLDKAEKINQNSFKINENAIVSMKVLETTQFSSEFDFMLLEGNEVDFYLFTTETEFEENPLLKITLTDKNYKIEKRGEIIAESDSINLVKNNFHRLFFHQEANLFRFKFDCKEIQLPEMKMNSSEYIILRTVGNTKALLQGLSNTENYDRLAPQE